MRLFIRLNKFFIKFNCVNYFYDFKVFWLDNKQITKVVKSVNFIFIVFCKINLHFLNCLYFDSNIYNNGNLMKGWVHHVI